MATEMIEFELFPAQVLVTPPEGGTETLVARKVYVFQPDRLEIYADSDAPNPPHLAYSGTITAQVGTRLEGTRFTIEDGTVFYVTRDSGCGCGSRLRGFRPYDDVAYGIQFR